MGNRGQLLLMFLKREDREIDSNPYPIYSHYPIDICEFGSNDGTGLKIILFQQLSGKKL